MNLDSIQALLEALKRSEGKGGLPGDDEDLGEPIAAKISVMHAVPDKGKGGAPDTSSLSDDALGASDDSDSDSSLGDMSDMMSSETDDDDEKENEQNAQIVDVLQDQYPTIYAKIMKQVSTSDQGSGDEAADSASSLASAMA